MYELNLSPTGKVQPPLCKRVNVTLSGALSIRQDSINRQHALKKKLFHELMSLEIKPEKGNELFSCPRAQFSTPAYALKYYPVGYSTQSVPILDSCNHVTK